jgi:hypothetical protein
LLHLLTLTGLDQNELLSGEGPITIFAPTDEAFGTLSNMTLESLLDDIPTLMDVLLYHVAPGLYISKDLEVGVSMTVPTALEGANWTIIAMEDGTVMVSNVPAAVKDLLFSNGVGHILMSSILVPEGMDLPTPVPSTVTPSTSPAEPTAPKITPPVGPTSGATAKQAASSMCLMLFVTMALGV